MRMHSGPLSACQSIHSSTSGSDCMAKLTCAPCLQGPSDIFNYDELQTKELFLGMVKRGEENCLSDNRWSAVRCQGAKRNSSMAQASKLAMPVEFTEEKPASAVAAAIKDAAEGARTPILLPTDTLQHALHHEHLFQEHVCPKRLQCGCASFHKVVCSLSVTSPPGIK